MSVLPHYLPPGAGLPVRYPSGYNCIDLCPPDEVLELGPTEDFVFSPFYRPVPTFGAGRGSPRHHEITACLPPKIEDNCRFWWILRAEALEFRGELNRTTGEIDYAPGRPTNYSSLLKADVELVDSNRGTTRFVADVGPGFQASIGPVQRLRLLFLEPDVEAYLNAGGDPSARTPDFFVKTRIHAAAVMADPVHSSLTFTQPILLTDVKPNWTIPLPNFAIGLKALPVYPPTPAGSTPQLFVEYLRQYANGTFQVLGGRVVDPSNLGEDAIPAPTTHVRVSLDVPPPAPYKYMTELVFRLQL